MPGGIEWLLILGLPIYFLPAIIAGARHHSNTLSIFILNLFLGWTFLGWIGSLIWAFSSRSKSTATVMVNNSPQALSQEYLAEKPGINQQIQPEVSQKQSTTQQDKIDQLRQFKQLLDEGIITNEEFNKQKASILSQ
jgi:hypothetical protein